MKSKYSEFLREVKPQEMKKWKPLRQSMALEIIEGFLNSDMEMAEVELDRFPGPTPRKDSSGKSTKQDSFASSFYAWKKKKTTKEKLTESCIDILLIRREDKIALKKVQRKKTE